MSTRRTIALLFTLGTFALALSAQPERRVKKPKEDKEPITQTLAVPREPPAAVSAETGKLVFHVSPLSAKGLLSQQIRDALKALDRANGGATIVKLRAFVAGGGDLRRVAAIVAEEFPAKKPLPAVSTIQVGALPLEGAQVVIESVSLDKKTVNPVGLAFFSAQSVTQLRTEATTLRAELLRITCFLSSLDEVRATRTEVSSAFPGVAADFVQLTRIGAQPLVACEAVGRPGELMNIPGVAVVSSPKLVFTGLQIAFRDQDADIRLAFERMRKALESQEAGYGDVVFTNTYSLSRSVAAKAAAVRPEFMDKSHPEGTAQVFEGLPSLDATLAIEVVAARH